MRSKQKKEPIIFQNGDEACCDELNTYWSQVKGEWSLGTSRLLLRSFLFLSRRRSRFSCHHENLVCKFRTARMIEKSYAKLYRAEKEKLNRPSFYWNKEVECNGQSKRPESENKSRVLAGAGPRMADSSEVTTNVTKDFRGNSGLNESLLRYLSTALDCS